MSEVGRDTPSREQRLDRVIREYLEARERGEDIEAEEVVRRHPDLTPELGEFLEDYDSFSWLKCDETNSGGRHALGPGDRIGDYEIVEELGRGGMGVVFTARQASLERLVALKVVLGGRFASEEDRRRFGREAVAAAQLDHPNIVSIHDVGEAEGLPYFSMRLVTGRSLAAARLDLSDDVRTAARVLEIIARAVHHAHERGVLHRDLKPANILLDEDGAPHVTDFGLAKLLSDDVRLTQSGAVLGTPSYMSPEQIDRRHAPITPATDVYGLGAMLYELITRRPPFEGASSFEIADQVRVAEPIRPRLLRPNVPVDLETICLKCIAKEPRRRYASALALAEDLARFLDGRPIEARPISAVGHAWRACARNPVVSSLTAGIILALLIVVVGLWRARVITQESLFQSYVDQATLLRRSGGPGQQLGALRLLESAARIRPDDAIGGEVLSCLALVDVERLREFDCYPDGTVGLQWSDYRFPAAVDRQFRRFATTSADGDVFVRSLEDGEVLSVFQAEPEVRHLTLSADGRYVAANQRSQRTLSVWDTRRGDEPFIEIRGRRLHRPIDFHPGGREVAIGLPDGSVALHELPSGERRRGLPLRGVGRNIQHVRYAPDGDLIALYERPGPLQLLDIQSGSVLLSRHFRDYVIDISWDPSGKYVALSTEHTIHLLHRNGKERSLTIKGHGGRVFRLLFRPDGHTLASSSADNSLRFWSLSGHQLLSLPDQEIVGFSEDGRLLCSMGLDGQIIVSRVTSANGPEWRLVAGLPETYPHDIGISPDERLLAIGTWFGTYLVDRNSRRVLGRLPTGLTLSAIFHQSGTSLFTWGAMGLYRWPIAGASPDREVVRIGPPELLGFESIGNRIGNGSLSPDGTTLVLVVNVDTGDTVTVDWRSPKSIVSMSRQGRKGTALMSPDGEVVAGGGSRGIAVWDASSGQPILTSGLSKPFLIGFSADGRQLITASHDEYFSWDAGDWTEQWRLSKERFCDSRGAMSRDGLLALRNTATSLMLVDVHTGRTFGTLHTPNRIVSLSTCRSGRHLFVAGAGLVYELDLERAGERLRSIGLQWAVPPFAECEQASGPLQLEVDEGILAAPSDAPETR